MPRQAARHVLGRSARAKPTAISSFQPFSTTPRHFDDNDANSSSRRDRSSAAASALGAMGSSSSSSSSKTPSKFGSNGFSGVPNLNRGRPGSNIISMKSLPQFRRPAQLGGSSDRPAPGSPAFVPRFAGRGGFSRGGDFARQGRGGFGRGGFGDGARGGFSRGRGEFVDGARGGFNRGRGGRGGSARGDFSRGGGRERGGAGRGGRGGRGTSGDGEGDRSMDQGGRTRDFRQKGEELLAHSNFGMIDEIEEYRQELQVHGPERRYTPSTTLESLVQWGPAVATNNALGQSAMAIRNMRLMGGGRRFHENEQSFDIVDESRWRSMSKPIFYSRVEQKTAALKMLEPEKREREVQKTIDRIVKSLQRTHGKNWSAFAEAYDKLGEAKIRSMAEEEVDANFAKHVNDFKMVSTKNKTTREAIAKFVLKGDHPEVKYAEDTHGKAARYHAHTPTYRPADGAKFDEKLKQLVKS